MPEFAKPTDFSFAPNLESELEALRRHGETRGVPTAHQDRLLLATWNLANFEVQDREGAGDEAPPIAMGGLRKGQCCEAPFGLRPDTGFVARSVSRARA